MHWMEQGKQGHLGLVDATQWDHVVWDVQSRYNSQI